jgi:hypothetical protein
MDLGAFLKVREALRVSRPELIDLSELNLYRSLAFPAIAPSTHAEAPYRCHLAERFLAHLGLPQELKARTQVSHGIRRSLRALFGVLAERGARVGIPSDVYPVYFQLAAEAGLPPLSPIGVEDHHVTGRKGTLALDDQLVLDSGRTERGPSGLDALLICEPLKPWGTTLTAADAARLRAWARADERRMLIIDSAYSTPPTPLALELMHDESAVLLVSLSKSWLIPDHAGLCIAPARFKIREAFAALPKEEDRLRIGYAALTEHSRRPLEVSARLAELSARLDALTLQRPELRASRCVGYFATAERSFDKLLELGVLGVPASVFGAPAALPRCVLSSLRR